MSFDSLTTCLPGVGPVRAAELRRAGYATVGSLLLHLPTRYQDRRSVLAVAALPRDAASEGTSVTVRGRLEGLRRIPTRRRGLSLVDGRLRDTSGVVRVVWFNRPYLPKQVAARGDAVWELHGSIHRSGRGIELRNPALEVLADGQPGRTTPFVPEYPRIGSLGPAAVTRLVRAALEACDPRQSLVEPLPGELLARHGLPALGEAVAALHDPPTGIDATRLLALRTPFHARLAYGELLALQLRLARRRRENSTLSKPHRYRLDDQARQAVRDMLPFELTGAQRRVFTEIMRDLDRPRPMQRLVQGDVGCGKTILAALAMLLAAESGLQTAFMAPTELLAEQHFETLSRLLPERFAVALLTSSSDDALRVRESIEVGEIDVVVGTHALIQGATQFKQLGLAIVDEQHRFGVDQRRRLRDKGAFVDILVMTATPIPRSLALTAFGDLDLSVIDELPPGRTPVTTQRVAANQRRGVYEQVRRALEEGSQAYVVLPLIDESDAVAAASIEKLGDRVRRFLSGFSVATLHGRLDPEERRRVMSSFASGATQVLIATSVIEVGVDVPRARIMVIESAERFGLAQLHQLRGRVGRGAGRSLCFAVCGALGEEARERLDAFVSTTDGFLLAEADLEIRGPGDLLGTRQSGVQAFRIANPVRDLHWLEQARSDARSLVDALDEASLQAAEELARPDGEVLEESDRLEELPGESPSRPGQARSIER